MPGCWRFRSRVPETRWHLSGFGLQLESDFPLPAAEPSEGSHEPLDLMLARVPRRVLDEMEAEPRFLRHLTVFDERPFAMLEATAGDILFQYGKTALFHLSADHRLLRCAVSDSSDRAWQRVLLDTILSTVSLLHGNELLHASSVETSAGVIAFSAASGGGKTSIAAEIVRRGGRFFSDDVLALERDHDETVVATGPPLMNLPVALPAEGLGDVEVLDRFGDEHWVQIRRARSRRRRLAAIVLLKREPGAVLSCERIEVTSLDLLPHVFGFFHLPGRMRRTFDLLGHVAERTPIFALSADTSLPAAQLVAALETQLAVTCSPVT